MPAQSAVAWTPDDLSEAGEAALDILVAKTWRLPLQPVALLHGYARHEFGRQAPRWIRALVAVDGEVRALARSLRSLGLAQAHRHHAPRLRSTRPASAHRGGGRVVAVVSPRRSAPSETFIRAHVQRLPAEVRLVHGTDLRLSTPDGVPLLGLAGRLADALAGRFGLDLAALRSRALARYLRRHRVEAVLAEFGHHAAHVRQACRLARVPLVAHFHGADAHRRQHVEANRASYAELFATAAAIVAVSRDMQRQLIALGAPAAKVAYNPCGVDTVVFDGADPASVPPRFVAVGRFIDKKGPLLTLLAFARVAEAVEGATLVMAGGGVLLESCRSLARTLGLADRVSFVGVLRHAQVARLLRTARAFVQHSLRLPDGDSEGTPVAVLEAGASGLPVVATAHAGIADVVVHGETGYLVPEGDVPAMARFMVDLARRPELAARLGMQAHRHVRTHYAMDRSIARLWHVIARAIASGPPGRR
jgi:glycosyltransferase involved in cell wall biosynthesis